MTSAMRTLMLEIPCLGDFNVKTSRPRNSLSLDIRSTELSNFLNNFELHSVHLQLDLCMCSDLIFKSQEFRVNVKRYQNTCTQGPYIHDETFLYQSFKETTLKLIGLF